MKKNYKVGKRRNSKKIIIRLFSLFSIFIITTTTLIGITQLLKNRYSANAQELMNDALEKQDNIENNQKYKSLEQDLFADDAAYVEKYLYEQNQGIIPEGADGKKVAYLTFDDGPSESVTPIILDVLKQYDVKATFFVLGRSINENKKSSDILRRMVKDGHALGNHTYSHEYNYLYPNKIVDVNNFLDEIEKTNLLLKETLGDILDENFTTRAIRFPGGSMSWKGAHEAKEILNKRDYYLVDWNALSKDSEGKPKNAAELVQEVKNTVHGREKAVILMHDNYGKDETAKALPEIIEYLKSEGYEFRTIK